MLLAFQATPAIDAAPAFVIIERARHLWDWVLAHTSNWQDLMTAAQSGDQRAYAKLLHEAAPFIRAIARRFHNPAAVEDVVQETLISIHRMRHTYEPGRPVEPWIAAIAKARAVDALRATTRRTALEAEAANLGTGASDQHGAYEAAAEVAVALDALPAAQREAVRLLKIEELSLNEAAAASGRSVPALKSLLHRAMSSLRASLRGGRDA